MQPLLNAPVLYTSYVAVSAPINDPPPLYAPDQSEETKKLPMLTLQKGDIVRIVQRYSGEYWLGATTEGQEGYFKLDERLMPVLGPKVRALWRHEPRADDEIAFEAGQVMGVVYQPSCWWIWGSYTENDTHHVGMIPFNFVESLPPEGQNDNPVPSSEIVERAQPAWVATPGLQVRVLWDYTARTPQEVSLEADQIVEVTSKWQDKWYYTTIGDKTGSFPMDYVTTDLTRRGRKLTLPPYDGYYVRVLWSNPSVDGELRLYENEIVEVLQMSTDGWWVGRNPSGQKGLFREEYTRPVLNARHRLNTIIHKRVSGMHETDD